MADSKVNQEKILEKRIKDEAWEWMLGTLKILIDSIGIPKELKADRDDIISMTLENIVKYGRKEKNQNFAHDIYQEKNTKLLAKILKKSIDLANGEQYFDNNVDFTRYKKIHHICEQYGISEEPKNAYMISELINEKIFSIPLVESILLKKKPKVIFLDKYEEPIF